VFAAAALCADWPPQALRALRGPLALPSHGQLPQFSLRSRPPRRADV